MSIHKTMAKNTLFIPMGFCLFTSRFVLDALGVVDYGIYGLVGGIEAILLSLIKQWRLLSKSIFPLILVETTKTDSKKTFNATLNIYFLIAFIILVLAETIDVFVINYKEFLLFSI